VSLDYYSNSRAGLVAGLPRPLGRTLDVGCGAGGASRSLRAAGATSITGIELDPEAADAARSVVDELHVGRVEDVLAEVEGQFNTICCYDVLEHLVDPAPVLGSLRRLAAPGGQLHISVPNARKINLAWDLIVRGTFGYRESGHRDRTHLRWFTHRDIVQLVADCGWEVRTSRGLGFGPRSSTVNSLTLGRAWEYWATQVEVLAVIPQRKPS
jgi:2-polyprenyl-3-methyl-5-hydroxy-6-metoxy-1,4-benzoquinol methylase